MKRCAHRTGLPGAKQGEVQPETGGIADASVSKDPGTRGVQAERADQLSNAGFHGYVHIIVLYVYVFLYLYL